MPSVDTNTSRAANAPIEADADLPVEAERLDRGLDRVAEPAAVAVLEVRRLFARDERGLRVRRRARARSARRSPASLRGRWRGK